MITDPEVDDLEDEGTLDDLDNTPDTDAGPYARAAWQYLHAGWAPLPLPPARKDPPPLGWTGGKAERYPSGPDVQAWIDGDVEWRRAGVTHTVRGGDGNIAVRPAADVIGLDVDCYGGKPGAATIAAHERQYGPLPATWTSTSRTDGSGIRWYRVPEGLRWRDLAGGGVEIIRAGHRYAVVWPSVHPDTGAIYRWVPPGANPTVVLGVLTVPSVHELAKLPDTWVLGLTGGELAVEAPRAGLNHDAGRAWITTPAGSAAACWRVTFATNNAVADLGIGASRHDVAMRHVQELAHLHNEGHRGVTAALATVRTAFEQAVGGDRDITEEWARMCAGAIDRAAGNVADHADKCSCDNPLGSLAGLIPPEGLASWQRPISTTPAASPANGSRPASQPSAATKAPQSSTPPATSPSTPPSGPSPLPSSTPSSPSASASGASAPSPSSPSSPTESPAGGAGGPVASSTADSVAGASSPAQPAPDDEAAQLAQAVAYFATEAYVREKARRLARERADNEDAAANWRPPVWVADLAAELQVPDEPVTYRIDGLLPSRGNVILTAQFKAGKTTMMNTLLWSLADGHRFLGHFETVMPERRIACWNYEVDAAQWRRWVRDVQIENAERVTHLPLRGYRMPLRDPRVEAWAVEWLKRHEVEVWVIDPLARAMVGSVDNENDNTQVGAFLDTIDVIKEKAGVSEVIIPVHTGRGGEERARGATRVDDWPDVAWTLVKNDEGERFFRAYGRDVDIAEGRLAYDYETRALRFIEGEDRKSKGNGELCAQVIAVVESQPGLNLTGLCAVLGRSASGRAGQEVREVVQVLAGQSTIRTTTEGRSVRLWPFSTSNSGGRP